jgi:hypothetical protein
MATGGDGSIWQPDGPGYYAAGAVNAAGNSGGSVPIYGGTTPAHRVRIVGTSWWQVSRDGAQINADGQKTTPGGPVGVNDRTKLLAPDLVPWSLIGLWTRWNDDGSVSPESGFFQCGTDRTIAVPAGADGSWHIRYACNDEDYGDNNGWIHVTEGWEL